MSKLIDQFQRLVGQNTRQIGRFYCIPAVASNALRLLGGSEFTQEQIRDVWYDHHGKTLESSPDDQMKGAGPDVIRILKQKTDFSTRFDSESFDLPSEPSFFSAGKADQTIDFIVKHTSQEHPVLVSTDSIPWEQGILTRLCCHMWLVLGADKNNNMAVAHDPGNDQLFNVPIQMAVPVKMGASIAEIEIGLRGRLTTSNYFCTAFWKK